MTFLSPSCLAPNFTYRHTHAEMIHIHKYITLFCIQIYNRQHKTFTFEKKISISYKLSRNIFCYIKFK